MKQAIRLAAVGSIGFLIFGCAGGPSVVLDTPTAVRPIYTPPAAMPGGNIGPPPGMDTSLPPPTQAVDRSGSYAGTAVPLGTAGGICLQTKRVSNFIVRGDRVRFGGFRGRIEADNGLQMVYGGTWITGQFEGATFSGQLQEAGAFNSEGCSYMLSLQRVAP